MERPNPDSYVIIMKPEYMRMPVMWTMLSYVFQRQKDLILRKSTQVPSACCMR